MTEPFWNATIFLSLFWIVTNYKINDLTNDMQHFNTQCKTSLRTGKKHEVLVKYESAVNHATSATSVSHTSISWLDVILNAQKHSFEITLITGEFTQHCPQHHFAPNPHPNKHTVTYTHMWTCSVSSKCITHQHSSLDIILNTQRHSFDITLISGE